MGHAFRLPLLLQVTVKGLEKSDTFNQLREERKDVEEDRDSIDSEVSKAEGLDIDFRVVQARCQVRSWWSLEPKGCCDYSAVDSRIAMLECTAFPSAPMALLWLWHSAILPLMCTRLPCWTTAPSRRTSLTRQARTAPVCPQLAPPLLADQRA